jgi:protocatechuate 4,5-dioxygenase alpha chain
VAGLREHRKAHMTQKDYEDIPGTFVFDADRSREGYHLNQFCITLRLQKNRDAFNANEEAYLDKFPMTPEQREAVLKREWNRLLELGGNIYYTSKLAANDGINFQNLAGLMTGMGVEAYREMMLNGGRSIEGNRYNSEWEGKE